MLQPVSLWIRLGLMRFKGLLHAGFRALKGITAMWWDFPWRWFTACWVNRERSKAPACIQSFRAKAQNTKNLSRSEAELGFLVFFFYFFFFLRIFPFFHRGLEVTD